MQRTYQVQSTRKTLLFSFVALALLAATSSFAADAHTHTSKPFTGVKANTGTVTHSKDGNKNILTLSDDFKGFSLENSGSTWQCGCALDRLNRDCYPKTLEPFEQIALQVLGITAV